jgi:hypothetical protein
MMSSFFRIPPNLRPVVYYYGVASGGVTEWDFVYNKYQQTVSSPNEKAFLMSAMAATKQSWILTRYSPVTKRVGVWVRNATAKHAWPDCLAGQGRHFEITAISNVTTLHASTLSCGKAAPGTSSSTKISVCFFAI